MSITYPTRGGEPFTAISQSMYKYSPLIFRVESPDLVFFPVDPAGSTFFQAESADSTWCTGRVGRFDLNKKVASVALICC